MIEISKNNVYKSRLFWTICLLIGLVIGGIFGYLYFFKDAKNSVYNKEVLAYKIDENCYIYKDGDESCSPIYYYKVDENEYVCKSKKASKEASDNKKLVYYKSDDPSYCITEYDVTSNWLYLACFGVGGILVLFGILGIINSYWKLVKINRLSKNGTLFKGVKYKLVSINSITGDDLMRPEVDLTLPNGKVIHLVGDFRYDKKYHTANSTVDVLIDLDHLNTYFIDYEIRVSSNIKNKIIDYRKPVNNSTFGVPKKNGAVTELTQNDKKEIK